MQGIPSYYGADDLMLTALYDEGLRICGKKPYSKTLDYPADSFHPSKPKTTNEKVKQGLTIGGIVAGAGALIYGACKLVGKFFSKGKVKP